MLFLPAKIPGVHLIEIEKREDPRGFFARTFCKDEFNNHGLHTVFPQSNLSYNALRGTLRGLHFQSYPTCEVKIVRCIAGTAFDVVIDLRKDSPAYCCWEGFELSAENRSAVYIPEGCAHGYQTLTDGTELLYMMGTTYSAGHASGVRWNDPAFSITWPLSNPLLSDRDASYSDYLP